MSKYDPRVTLPLAFSVILIVAAGLTGCTAPLKINPAMPIVPGSEPDVARQAVSAITFDLQGIENKTWSPRVRGLQVDQRVFAQPSLSQIIRDDVSSFLTRHVQIEPGAPAEVCVTLRKAQIIKYSWPIASAALPSRGLGTEADVEIQLRRTGAAAATCQISDPVQIEGSYIFTSGTYSKVVEQLVTRYRQSLMDALGSRCAPLFRK